MFIKYRIMKKLNTSKSIPLERILDEFGHTEAVGSALDELAANKYAVLEDSDMVSLYSISAFRRFKKDLLNTFIEKLALLIAAITGIYSALK